MDWNKERTDLGGLMRILLQGSTESHGTFKLKEAEGTWRDFVI